MDVTDVTDAYTKSTFTRINTLCESKGYECIVFDAKKKEILAKKKESSNYDKFFLVGDKWVKKSCEVNELVDRFKALSIGPSRRKLVVTQRNRSAGPSEMRDFFLEEFLRLEKEDTTKITPIKLIEWSDDQNDRVNELVQIIHGIKAKNFEKQEIYENYIKYYNFKQLYDRHNANLSEEFEEAIKRTNIYKSSKSSDIQSRFFLFDLIPVTIYINF